ncbi:hypothetical protein KGO06_02330 [Patescibacteria group bacterium]|nr:hypothetical protein [Patescibacteria group bacterium]
MARTPQQDLAIVVLLMIALGVAWYYTGGTESDLARGGPLFSQQQGSTIPGIPIPRVFLGGTEGQDEGPKSTTITTYLGAITEERSPYANRVSLSASLASASLDGEYLTLRVNSSAESPITISGWKLESSVSGLRVAVPLAVALPAQGSNSIAEPVALAPGHTAYLITKRSPIGTSFRTNLCTGYFEQFQDFTPPLSLDCPRPTTEADTYFALGTYTDECESIVRSLGRCEFSTKSVPGSAGNQCVQFVTTELSYNGCVARHKTQPGFYRDTWYLFLSRDSELWRSRSERIRLLDENDKVVSVITY